MRHTFYWSDLIDHSNDIMFFGPPFHHMRSFDALFKNKADLQYIFHVFRGLAPEYWGDATASAQLYSAYLRRRADVLEVQRDAAPAKTLKELYRSLKTMTRTQKVFCSLFDGLCKNEFELCVTSFNDYGVEMVLQEDIERFMDAAEHKAFPVQWKVLAGMRGVNENLASEKGAKTEWKRRHVFFQLLSTLRMSNPKLLSWWAMIQSVANFGWGVGATAGDIMSYWGNRVATTTRNERITTLTSNLTFHYRQLLRKSRARLFCFDNFQIGQEIKEQRGKHSSTFFKGTTECAHRVCEYNDTQWDDSIKVEVTGQNNQDLPSPPGMARYESAPANRNLGEFILNHKDMEGVPEPDKGKRVNEYMRVLKHTAELETLKHVFSRSEDHYQQCPDNMRDAALQLR